MTEKPGPHFPRIEDPRHRLEALLSYGFRKGSADDYDAVTYDALEHIDLTAFDRTCVARHLVALMEAEIGRPVEEWFPPGEGGRA